MEGVTLHTRLDTIMFGCLMALLYDNATFNRIVRPLLRPSLVLFSAAFFVIASPLLDARFEARYSWPVGYTLRAVCVSLVLLHVVRNPASPAGRVLNSRVLRHVGLISYGLYLWQQLFTEPSALRWPWIIILTVLCAELSYQLVERPAFHLRDRIQKRMRTAARMAATGPA